MTLILGTPAEWLWYTGLGGVLGVTGQFIRAVGGAKKVNDQANTLSVKFADVFNGPAFLTSLATGFAAGVLAALATQPTEIGKTFLLSIIAAGYAGSDFIEAFMRKASPDMQQLLRKQGPDSAPLADAAKVASDAKVSQATEVARNLFSSHSAGTAALPETREVLGHPTRDISIPDEVRGVIARSKGLSDADVTDGRKLADLNYTDGDCLALEWAINRYFFNNLHLAFDRLLDGPEDIRASHTVADVVAKVRSLHPRRRA